METLGEAHVGEEILTPIGGARPGRVLQERLAPQLLGDAQALQGAEASDPFAPVRVLRIARRGPVAGDELANTACDHVFIVARSAPANYRCALATRVAAQSGTTCTAASLVSWRILFSVEPQQRIPTAGHPALTPC